MPRRFGIMASAGVDAVPNNGGSNLNVRKGVAQSWHPTVAFLMLLVVAEWATLVFLRYTFRHAHGG